MRVDRSRLNWGIFFIALGAVPLAYHQGVVSASALGDAWRLWPLIIVGIGLSIILSRTPAFFLGGTVVAICLGLVFGSVLATPPTVACGGDGSSSSSVARAGSFDGGASVDLDLQCGSATITTSTDGQWHVNASNNAGRMPQVVSTPDSLQVTSGSQNGWSFDRGKDDWQIALPSTSQIDLTSTLSMGDARFNLASANLGSARFVVSLSSFHLDLTGAHVGSLTVTTSLGATYLTLDGSSNLTADLKTSLGSLEVCIPAGLGVQVSGTDSLSSSDFAGAGLIRSASGWQTPNYSSAPHQATINFNTSLGSLKLLSAGGCK